MGNKLSRMENAVDRLYAARGKADFWGKSEGLRWNGRRGGLELRRECDAVRRSGTYTSDEIACEVPSTEFLPSWNLELDEQTQGYRVFLRVKNAGGKWSPWFYFGSGGTLVPKQKLKSLVVGHPQWGEVPVDYLVMTSPAVAFQYRVILSESRKTSAKPPCLKRFFVSVSGRGDSPEPSVPVRRASVQIAVPYRSQRTVEIEKLRGIICCPTCVAMLLEFYGVNLPTLEVCSQALDREHGIYGVWPRAVHAAAHNGLEGWIRRFRTHDQVREQLAQGQPVMASIRVKEGELRGAEYPKSNGHLILLVGYTRNGNYMVNDPYSVGPKGGAIEYRKDDIEKVWLDKGGVGLMIRKPEKA